MPCYAVSDLGLHGLLRPACPNTLFFFLMVIRVNSQEMTLR